MNWESNFISLGTVYVGMKKIIIFKALKELNIKKITPGCGCTAVRYSKIRKELKVVYTPKPIPNHLVQQGYQISHKSIRILYTDGSVEILTFKSLVKNKT